MRLKEEDGKISHNLKIKHAATLWEKGPWEGLWRNLSYNNEMYVDHGLSGPKAAHQGENLKKAEEWHGCGLSRKKP